MVDIKLNSTKSTDENKKELSRTVAAMTLGCPRV